MCLSVADQLLSVSRFFRRFFRVLALVLESVESHGSYLTSNKNRVTRAYFTALPGNVGTCIDMYWVLENFSFVLSIEGPLSLGSNIHWRRSKVTHHMDPVPHVPPEDFGYQHLASEAVSFTCFMSSESWIMNHIDILKSFISIRNLKRSFWIWIRDGREDEIFLFVFGHFGLWNACLHHLHPRSGFLWCSGEAWLRAMRGGLSCNIRLDGWRPVPAPGGGWDVFWQILGSSSWSSAHQRSHGPFRILRNVVE